MSRSLPVRGLLAAGLYVGLAACGAQSSDAPDAAAHPLSPSAYRFCHTPGADADQAEIWCELVDEIPEERCPGLRATCEGAEPVPPSGCQQGSGGGAGRADQLADAPEAPPDDPFSSFDLEGAEAVLRWVMALLVAFGVLLLARFLWTWFGTRRREEEEPEPVLLELDDDIDDDALPDVPAAPSTDLLTLARSALEEGRAGDAAVLARGAALRSLGEKGRLRLHRSRTDREYVRSVESSEERADLRTVVAAAEAFRFGLRTPPKAVAEAAIAAAARLVRASLWLVVGLVALGAPAHGQTPERYGPDGDAALLELYRLWGHEASWRLRGLDQLTTELDALVLDTTTLVVDAERWPELRSWVEEGGVLLVAGDASAGFPELGAVASGQGPVAVQGPAAWASLPAPHLVSPVLVYESTQAQPWVVDATGRPVVVVVALGAGAVVGLADASLLANASMAVPDNEVFLGELFGVGQVALGWPLATPIRVQLATQGAVSSSSSSGASTNNPLAALSHAELLPFVLHLLLLWTLVAMWRGWPFGPRRDPPGEGRLRFADHVEALGERYRRLGATRHVLSAYAGLWLGRIGPAGLQLAAQRAGMSRDDAVRWVEELEAVVATPDGPDDERDIERMEELWKVLEQR